jgi:Protein of unknown function (DUF1559)
VIQHNGVFRLEKGVKFGDIPDGLTHTILIGEKHVPAAGENITPWDCAIYDGHNPACSQRSGGPGFPLTSAPSDLSWSFGSSHPGICQFVFCDGTVRSVRNGIDPVVLGLLAQRNDQMPVPDF